MNPSAEPRWDETDEIIFGLRRCPACGRELPRSREFFAPDRRGPGGLSSHCRACRRESFRESNRRRAMRAAAAQP